MDTLNQEQIEAALGELDGWGFEDEALTRTFRFADFVHAIDFVEHLAEVAEERQHHPDIDIRYNKVTLRLSSTTPAASRSATSSWPRRSSTGLSAAAAGLARRRAPERPARPPC